jgi:hypothetical protein
VSGRAVVALVVFLVLVMHACLALPASVTVLVVVVVLQNDFGGHDNVHHDNVYAYTGIGFQICPQLPGHIDSFYNNKVVLNSDGDYGFGACSGDAMPLVYGNAVYSPTGAITECGMSLAAWQKLGNDPNTTAGVTPDDDTIVAWGRAVLMP